MTLELVAVIAIGTAFLIVVLVVVERAKWSDDERAGSRRLASPVDGAPANPDGRRGIARAGADARRPAREVVPAGRPVPIRPARIVVSGERRRTPEPWSAPESSFLSPRRRLLRDATAVLAVGAAAAFVVVIGGQEPRAGVLSATSLPRPVAASPAADGSTVGPRETGCPSPPAGAVASSGPGVSPPPERSPSASPAVPCPSIR